MRSTLAHKTWTRWFLILATLLLVLSGITVFTVDPLQHYRRATFYRPLWGNHRYYDPGFVKHYDYDCIMIGSSMVKNFIPSEVGRSMSMKTLLAPLHGGGLYEECVLLNSALRTGKVKAVIWGLDISGFAGGRRRLVYGPGSFPFYLYDDNPFNDYQYLLNIDVLLKDCGKALAANLLPRWKRAYRRAMDLDSAHFSGDKSKFAREKALKRWRRPRREQSTPGATRELYLDSMEASFDSNVLPLVAGHPEVKYYLFYPPYSILYWISYDTAWFQAELEFKRYVFSRTRGLANVRLFDFQDVGDITLDLNNYKDWSHYSPDVSKFITSAISSGRCLVTDDNVEEKIGRLEDQVRTFTDSLDAGGRNDSAGARESPGQDPPWRQEEEDPEP